VDPAEVGSGVGRSEVGPVEVGSGVGRSEVGPVEVGSGVGRSEVGSLENRPLSIGRPEVGRSQFSPLEIRPFEIGVLFPDTRRRLRLRVNGIARPTRRGLAIDTAQVFTNCPGRLRHRSGEVRPPLASGPTASGESLSPVQRAWIREADTFFIATASDTGAADASHRGGEPGFVEVVSPTELTWAEYPGNSMFMTLGNLVLNPRAGVLFLDERSGVTLHLTGTARVRLTDARPTVHFTITRVVQVGDVGQVGVPGQEGRVGQAGEVGQAGDGLDGVAHRD
jgi:uncharacterized protein